MYITLYHHHIVVCAPCVYSKRTPLARPFISYTSLSMLDYHEHQQLYTRPTIGTSQGHVSQARHIHIYKPKHCSHRRQVQSYIYMFHTQTNYNTHGQILPNVTHLVIHNKDTQSAWPSTLWISRRLPSARVTQSIIYYLFGIFLHLRVALIDFKHHYIRLELRSLSANWFRSRADIVKQVDWMSVHVCTWHIIIWLIMHTYITVTMFSRRYFPRSSTKPP
jgi:hypothetical protein